MASLWAFLTLTLVVSPALGFFSFQERIPNGNNIPHPCKANYRWPGVGHQNPQGGGARNAFGEDFDQQGYRWTTALCQMDSDGDGLTNGDELGDPNCVWTQGQIPSRITDISHPGVCEPFGSTRCQGKNDFVSCEVDAFENCEAINNPDVRSIDVRFTRTAVPNVETSYFCMTFDLDTLLDQDYHVIADEGIIDNQEVMHHMLLFGCSDDGDIDISTPEECGMGADKCSNLIGLWSVGRPGNCYGNGLGFRVGQSGYKKVLLQSHWNNPMLRSDYTDSSGMRLYFQPARAGVQDLATLMIGQNILEIPPGEPRVVQEGICPSECTSQYFKQSIYLIQVLNHAHYLGRSIKVEHFRDGRLINVLSNDEVYNYDTPVEHAHDPPIEIRPGDELKTTCVFNSLSSNRYVYMGEGTNDEMCYAFLTIYPASAVPDEQRCNSFGVLSQCAMEAGKPLGECNWAMIFDPSSTEATETFGPLVSNCNMDGFCRPECRPVVERLRRHPCFYGEAWMTVRTLLQFREEGIKILARMSSCPEQHDGQVVDCRSQCSDICSDNVYDSVPGTGPATIMVVVMATLTSMLF